MVRRIMVAALASAALSLPGAALAGPGKAKVAKAERTAGKAAAKSARAAQKAAVKAQRSSARAGARGASARAGSLLSGGTVVSGPLTGLSVGAPVHLGGEVAGTVERIVPAGGREVRNVLVRTSDGRIVPLAPGSLAFDGSGWTATSLDPSANRRRR